MATGNDQNLNIVVRLKDEASIQLDKFKNKVESMQPTFQKMAVVGTAAFVGIAAVAYKSVQAFAEVERSQRQLEHAVIDVSKGTKEQVKQIEAAAEALEKKAGVDADSVKMGAAQLSTFGLQSKSVVDLTKSLADLTVNQSGVNATADDYVASANTIAKALNGQFGILEKSGIRFTEAQQNIILYGTEAEKVAAIQEGFNQNLRETTDTLSGADQAMAKMSRSTENIQENIGRALLPALLKIAEVVQPIIEKFAEWAEANPQLITTLVVAGGAIAAIVASLGFLGIIIPIVTTAFTAMAIPVAAIIGIIGGLVLIISNLDKIMQLFKNDSDLIWIGIKESVKESINGMIGLVEAWANSWVKATNTIIDALNTIQVNVPDWVPKIGGKSFGISLSKVNEIKLPRMEHGGIVPGARGTAVPIIAHGQEQIIPAGNVSSGGAVYISVVLNNPSVRNQDDVTVIRDQIDRALRDVIRTNKLQRA